MVWYWKLEREGSGSRGCYRICRRHATNFINTRVLGKILGKTACGSVGFRRYNRAYTPAAIALIDILSGSDGVQNVKLCVFFSRRYVHFTTNLVGFVKKYTPTVCGHQAPIPYPLDITTFLYTLQ